MEHIPLGWMRNQDDKKRECRASKLLHSFEGDYGWCEAGSIALKLRSRILHLNPNESVIRDASS